MKEEHTPNKLGTYSNLSNLSAFRPFLKRKVPIRLLHAFVWFLRFVGARFGVEFVISIPEEISGYENDAYEALAVAEILKRKGIAEVLLENPYQHADEPRTPRFLLSISGPRRHGHGGAGVDFFDRTKALWRTVGEAIERWCLDVYRVPAHHIREAVFFDNTFRKISIFSGAGFSEGFQKKWQHSTYSIVADESTPIAWVPARSLIDGKTLYAPYQWFSFSYSREILEGKVSEPLLSPPTTNGAAVHRTLSRALTTSILELIERDAFMIYWLNELSPREILFESLPGSDMEYIRVLAARYLLEIHILYLQTDAPTHTIFVVGIDRTGKGPAVTVGAKSDFNLLDAIRGGLEEVICHRSGLRSVIESNANKKIKGPEDIDHIGRMIYWADMEKIPKLDFLFKGQKISFQDIQDIVSPVSDNEKLGILVTYLKNNGYEAVYQDIMDPKLRKELLGFHAVMVRIPELIPLYLEEIQRCEKGERLHQIPKLLGFSPKQVLNKTPHPFP